jgi:hypothetical protein
LSAQTLTRRKVFAEITRSAVSNRALCEHLSGLTGEKVIRLCFRLSTADLASFLSVHVADEKRKEISRAKVHIKFYDESYFDFKYFFWVEIKINYPIWDAVERTLRAGRGGTGKWNLLTESRAVNL